MLSAFLLAAALFAASSRAETPPGAPAAESVKTLAMRWFALMQKGEIDGSQYAPGYAAQITDSAVREMSSRLNQYGAAPARAEISLTRTSGAQTFYVVKFIFPRGDATTLLFGFDGAGKISGIGVAGLAGD
jgi:hypothetical protein